MNSKVITKVRPTVKDLYSVRGKAELINGEIVLFPPFAVEVRSEGDYGKVVFTFQESNYISICFERSDLPEVSK
jgi:hypothetical protein